MTRLKRMLSRISKKNLLLIAGVFVVGSLIGVGLFTFIYAKGISYLGNDPASCANCHVMEDHYDAWLAGSHTNVATCNDCHAPWTASTRPRLRRLRLGIRSVTG